MKRYIKDNKIKFRNEIVIRRNGMQTINPSEEQILADGWEEYVPPTYEPTEEEIFNREKKYLKEEIIRYDSSDEVNIFYVNEQPIWLDKNTRTGLMLRFQSEQILGDVETTLWYGSQKFVLPIETAQMMLHQIEKYASQCYDNTQMHLATIDKIDNIDDLKHYDYRTGYPEKLRF